MVHNFNSENAAEMGRKGGIKSGESRRRKRELKNIASDILAMPIKDGDLEDFDYIEDAKGKNVSLMENIFLIQALKANKGDRQAAEFCFKYGGLEPSQNVEIKADVNETNDEVANILNLLSDFKENPPKYSGKNKKKS
jgi:hypothetical protein